MIAFDALGQVFKKHDISQDNTDPSDYPWSHLFGDMSHENFARC